MEVNAVPDLGMEAEELSIGAFQGDPGLLYGGIIDMYIVEVKNRGQFLQVQDKKVDSAGKTDIILLKIPKEGAYMGETSLHSPFFDHFNQIFFANIDFWLQ